MTTADHVAGPGAPDPTGSPARATGPGVVDDESRRIRAVVVDDSTTVRFALPRLHPEIEVVAAHHSSDPRLAERPAADLVILDLRLTSPHSPDTRQGAVAVQAVAEAGYRICLYTDEFRRAVLAQCLRAGARGVVHKSDPVEDAAAAFRTVASGGAVITQSLLGLAELVERRGGLPELTDRQRSVLAGRARGDRWSDIARRLYISEGVAREHMAAVQSKFATYLQDAAAADIERWLGLAPGDLLHTEPGPH